MIVHYKERTLPLKITTELRTVKEDQNVQIVYDAEQPGLGVVLVAENLLGPPTIVNVDPESFVNAASAVSLALGSVETTFAKNQRT